MLSQDLFFSSFLLRADLLASENPIANVHQDYISGEQLPLTDPRPLTAQLTFHLDRSYLESFSELNSSLLHTKISTLPYHTLCLLDL